MKISKKQLKELTDGRSWKRGLDYYDQGNVISLFEDKGTITAKVRGTHIYRVKLWTKDGQLDGSCSCPMGEAGVFCKHCVAVGLTYLEGGVDTSGGAASKTKKTKSTPAITSEDVRKYLFQQKTDTLVEIIMDQVAEDENLRERLVMKAARFGRKDLDIETFRRAITQATNTHGFVDYYSAYDFASRIDNVVDNIEELLTDGYAQQVIELAEHALKRVEKALGEIDDSDGCMGGILERLQEIHHKACVEAKPDPEVLAKRLFEWELTTGWDTFYRAAEAYADVFGEKGLDVYRNLAKAEWAKVPPLKPGQMERGYYGHRFRITSIMEALAHVSGDVEAIVAVKSKDLSSAYRFLEIAQVYKDAGKSDKALQWAEKGLMTFPQDTDSRLREFLADEYHRRKRHSEAMGLIWANFADRPGLENYKTLKKHADCTKEWPKWRQQTLEHIRAMIAKDRKRKPQASNYWSRDPDHSLLVEIFIWEKDTEAAWREAQAGSCSDYLWMQLAKLREKDYPKDAIMIYQRQVEPIVEQTNNRAYREAIMLIKKIQGLMKGLEQEKEFEEYKSSLEAKYKLKRNFITLLGRLR